MSCWKQLGKWTIELGRQRGSHPHSSPPTPRTKIDFFVMCSYSYPTQRAMHLASSGLSQPRTHQANRDASADTVHCPSCQSWQCCHGLLHTPRGLACMILQICACNTWQDNSYVTLQFHGCAMVDQEDETLTPADQSIGVVRRHCSSLSRSPCDSCALSWHGPSLLWS